MLPRHAVQIVGEAQWPPSRFLSNGRNYRWTSSNCLSPLEEAEERKDECEEDPPNPVSNTEVDGTF